ncbi:putative E3 ubiquitin-protein ligase LIN [Camellia sinensis]|uniref:putative E3 ubiquitin-protein ligase LIN n=1 Tax=Camellia sinensis TaxID=4442 RepID=UPI00103603FD|nr:putative E3 ubiquitin-protein ligase LIN [Camellia sinensis]
MHSWGGGSKLLNPNKSAKCITLLHGKLYSGCQDNSIQEIDLATGTLNTIQSGSRKLLGKANPIHALNIRDGLLYSASSSLDGAAVKIWNASNYSMVGSLPLTLEVRAHHSFLVGLNTQLPVEEAWISPTHSTWDSLCSNCIINWRRLWKSFASRASCVHCRRRPSSNNPFSLPIEVYGYD